MYKLKGKNSVKGKGATFFFYTCICFLGEETNLS